MRRFLVVGRRRAALGRGVLMMATIGRAASVALMPMPMPMPESMLAKRRVNVKDRVRRPRQRRQ